MVYVGLFVPEEPPSTVPETVVNLIAAIPALVKSLMHGIATEKPNGLCIIHHIFLSVIGAAHGGSNFHPSEVEE
jgi:hypothetical protein